MRDDREHYPKSNPTCLSELEACPSQRRRHADCTSPDNRDFQSSPFRLYFVFISISFRFYFTAPAREMRINFDPDREMRIRQLRHNASVNSYRTGQRSLRHTSHFFPLMSSKKQLQAKLKAVRASRKPTPAPKKGKENKAPKSPPEKKKRGAPSVRCVSCHGPTISTSY